MRTRLVVVAGALDQCEAPGIENLFQSGESRMEPERNPRRVGADLQHRRSGHRQRRPAAVVERIVVGHQHAERVVAAAQVEDHEIAGVSALRARQVGQELGRRKRHRERGDPAFHEFAPGDSHGSSKSEV
jgi:hypothetical protein